MKTRIVQTRFWKDEYITTLNCKEKLVFLYLLTNETINLVGIYQIYPKEISMWCEIPLKEVVEIINKFQNDKKIFYKDGWIKILNHKKYQNYGAGTQKIAFERELLQIPKSIVNIDVDTSINTSMDTTPILDINKKQEIRNKKQEIINTKIVNFEDEWLEIFRKVTGRGFRMLDDKTKNQIKKLIESGYCINDWEVAITNANKDKFLTGDNDKNKNYLTPEYISRPQKFEFFINQKNDSQINIQPMTRQQRIMEEVKQDILKNKKF